jgi:hypothetical protein
MIRARVVSLVVGTLTVGLLAGCGDKYGGRVEVAGTVKLKGQPLKAGILMFEPVGGQGTSATASIIDGNYKLPRESGLKPGKYLIRVTSGDGKTPANLNPDEPPGPGGKGTNIVSKELVPPEWNVRSKQEREVTSDNPNKLVLFVPPATCGAGFIRCPHFARPRLFSVRRVPCARTSVEGSR